MEEIERRAEAVLAEADEALGEEVPPEERRRRRGRLLRDNPTMITLAERDRPQDTAGGTEARGQRRRRSGEKGTKGLTDLRTARSMACC